MFFKFNNTISLFFYIFVLLILSYVNSLPFQTKSYTSLVPAPTEYKRLASHCHINDYTAWLEKQEELLVWLNLAKILNLPIQDSELIQQELEQFRLQHECLRVIERLPVSIGPG